MIASRNTFSVIIVISLILQSIGCTKYDSIIVSPKSPEKLWEGLELKIEILDGNYYVVRFVQFGEDSLRGIDINTNERISISHEEIKSIEPVKPDEGKLSLIWIPLLVAGTLIFRVIFTEEIHHHHGHTDVDCGCPRIYSFNGDSYILDADVLTGALSPSLQYEDVSLLENIKANKEIYSIRVKNEVYEVQYLDRISLTKVEHPLGTIVLLDNFGIPHTLQNLLKPIYAYDYTGGDHEQVLSNIDSIGWGANVSDYDIGNNNSTNMDTIEIEFERPNSAVSAKLVIRAKNTTRAENVISDLIQIIHPNLNGWLKSLEEDEFELVKLKEKIRRGFLKIEIMKGQKWEPLTNLKMLGSATSRTQLVLIDSLDQQNQGLKLRLSALKGTWDIDYIAVDYSIDKQTIVEKLSPLSKNGAKSIGGLALIQEKDNNHLVIPPGGTFDMNFSAGNRDNEHNYTIFVNAYGYYQPLPVSDIALHSSIVVDKILTDKEYAAQFSIIITSVYPWLQKTFFPALLSYVL